MRTVGTVLKESRKSQNISLQELSRTTRIRVGFLGAIEKEQWATLPEYPVVVGFIKNMADTLSLDRDQIVALLRRDYPPQKTPLNPKPDVGTPFTWGPKLTFAIGAVILILGIIGYLFFQYRRFVTPPRLVVNYPSEGEQITERNIVVSGETGPESTIVVNNQPAFIEGTGKFTAEIAVTENTVTIQVTARSRAGHETTLTRNVSVSFENQ